MVKYNKLEKEQKYKLDDLVMGYFVGRDGTNLTFNEYPKEIRSKSLFLRDINYHASAEDNFEEVDLTDNEYSSTNEQDFLNDLIDDAAGIRKRKRKSRKCRKCRKSKKSRRSRKCRKQNGG